MKRPVFAANWKMNHGPTDARAFMRTFLSHYQRHTDRTVVIFPSALALHVVVEAARDRADVKVGVQNIHAEDKGAFTGELSNAMARDAGAKVVPRRPFRAPHIFGETDADTGRKCAAAARAGSRADAQRGRDERAAASAARPRRWSPRSCAPGSRCSSRRAAGVTVAYEPGVGDRHRPHRHAGRRGGRSHHAPDPRCAASWATGPRACRSSTGAA
jgi:triosephosphate isomerase